MTVWAHRVPGSEATFAHVLANFTSRVVRWSSTDASSKSVTAFPNISYFSGNFRWKCLWPSEVGNFSTLAGGWKYFVADIFVERKVGLFEYLLPPPKMTTPPLEDRSGSKNIQGAVIQGGKGKPGFQNDILHQRIYLREWGQ